MANVRSLTAAVVAIGGALLASLHASPDVVTPTVPGRASSAPSIAADAARVVLAWGARAPQGGADVYVAVSRDGGRAFGAAVPVSGPSGTARIGGEMPPRVTVSGSRVDVVWTARAETTRILTATSVDGGMTFQPPRALERPGAPGDRGWPALAAAGQGQLHAVWLDHRGASGTHHAPPEKSAILYNGGAGEVEIAKGVCYCCKTAVAAGVDGRVFAAWRQVYPGNMRDIAFSMSADRGRTFAPPLRVSEDRWQLEGCPDDGPAMTVDGAGVAHVVWPSLVDRPEPHKAIFYSWTQDGRSFRPRVRVTPPGRHAAHPQVVAHRAGVTVVWDEVVDGVRRVAARRRSRSNWDFAPVVLSDGRTAATYPVAAVVRDEVVIAWVQGGGAASTIAVGRLRIR